MAWQTPKTNWSTDDVIATTDLNRMEENTKILKIGGDNGASIASAANLEVVKNYHLVTGTTQINFIKTTGWAAGACIDLTFDDNLNLDHKHSTPPSGYAAMWINTLGGAESSTTGATKPTYRFIYDGTYWRNIGLAL
jgi:hypothetical protein